MSIVSPEKMAKRSAQDGKHQPNTETDRINHKVHTFLAQLSTNYYITTEDQSSLINRPTSIPVHSVTKTTSPNHLGFNPTRRINDRNKMSHSLNQTTSQIDPHLQSHLLFVITEASSLEGVALCW